MKKSNDKITFFHTLDLTLSYNFLKHAKAVGGNLLPQGVGEPDDDHVLDRVDAVDVHTALDRVDSVDDLLLALEHVVSVVLGLLVVKVVQVEVIDTGSSQFRPH